ncbi:MAG: hypothetical protein M3320_09775 [Actinomycetota bacterium]|nr:hypothetical protein [Actinomycetota bacterium]MDQ5808953.1 hypothetical protein [Actinomycetota bacterium]
MSRRSVLLVVAGGVALAAVLGVVLLRGGGGCGDGYPDSPECVAEAFMTRTDGSVCDLVEPRLLERIVGARGAAARERCARTMSIRRAPDEIDVLEREPSGDAVVVEFVADGEEGSVTVRHVDGRWRIVSFAE